MKDDTSKQEFVVIHTNEDGETTVEQLPRAELLKRLDEDYWGVGTKLLSKVPENGDTAYWGAALMVVAGNIVTSKSPTLVSKRQLVEDRGC